MCARQSYRIDSKMSKMQLQPKILLGFMAHKRVNAIIEVNQKALYENIKLGKEGGFEK